VKTLKTNSRHTEGVGEMYETETCRHPADAPVTHLSRPVSGDRRSAVDKSRPV
jgi:hypothetical protein